MAVTRIMWSIAKLVEAICDRLENGFDAFLVVEGRRGLGKSTLSLYILRRVSREMKKRGHHKYYKFHLTHSLLYRRKEVLNFFHRRHACGMADEMINVSFNRDFYNEEQKDLIKMINMNRDHHNLFIACVPRFKNLDSQIKNLCSMKITVVRRGVGIIHMPNPTVYSRDIWDEAFNEKIEREWLKSGVFKPRYTRLSTFKGYIKFPKLHPNFEKKYQEVKDKKRNIIEQEKGYTDEEKLTPEEKIYRMLIEFKVKNSSQLEGYALAHDMEIGYLKGKLNRMLKKNKKPTGLSQYFFDSDEYKSKLQKQKELKATQELLK